MAPRTALLLLAAAATVACAFHAPAAFLASPCSAQRLCAFRAPAARLALASPRCARRLRATPLAFEHVSTLVAFVSKRPEINAAANESFFEKAPLVFGAELGLALLVYVAFKISGRGDALEGYDLLGRKKEKGE